MRVLMGAHFCDPEDGSEPGIGWAFAAAAAENHEVWVLTHARFEPNISRALASRPELDLHPVYLPAAPLEDRFERISYWLWQRRARKIVRELHARAPFDLTHHVTVSSTYMPSALTVLDTVPLVYGPVVSVPAPPIRLWRYMGARGVVEEVVRSAVTTLGRHLYGRPMARQAVLVVAAEDATPGRLGRPDAVIEPHAAVPPIAPAESPSPSVGVDEPAKRTAVYAGRLLYWKGLRIAVRALARDEASNWSFDVYGEGPEATELERIAREEGVGDRLRLRGRVSRSEVFDAVRSADAFLMPSLHDGCGWSIAEALTIGCPVVCLELGGPKTLVRLAGHDAVSVTGDVEQNIAEALAVITTRNEPTDRYSIDRLPQMVDSWYRAARDAAA